MGAAFPPQPHPALFFQHDSCSWQETNVLEAEFLRRHWRVCWGEPAQPCSGFAGPSSGLWGGSCSGRAGCARSCAGTAHTEALRAVTAACLPLLSSARCSCDCPHPTGSFSRRSLGQVGMAAVLLPLTDLLQQSAGGLVMLMLTLGQVHLPKLSHMNPFLSAVVPSQSSGERSHLQSPTSQDCA